MMTSTSFSWDNGEEFGPRLFALDSLTEYEFYETTRRQCPLEPEIHLMHAILEDAIDTYRLYVHTKSGPARRLFLDAQRWIWARNEGDWPFSFENICAVLGLDPSFMRSGLERWKERQRHRMSLPISQASICGCGAPGGT